MEPKPTLEMLIPLYLGAVYRVREPGGQWYSLTFDPKSITATDDPGRLSLVQPWAIITAWNPMSVRMPDAENAAAQARLVEAVHALGLPIHPAESLDRSDPPAWREESILVERLEWKPAVQLIKVFRQGAAVYGAGGRAGLLFADPERWDVYPIRIAPE